MNLGLEGRTALVFGGSKGLGRATAEALAAEGVAVALIARDPQALKLTANEIGTAYGVNTFGYAADLSDWNSVLRAVQAAEQDLGGRIDVLVNNTIGPPPSDVSGVAPDLWSAQFDAMVLSVLRITDHVLPGMRERRWGRVLTIASSVVVEPAAPLGISGSRRPPSGFRPRSARRSLAGRSR